MVSGRVPGLTDITLIVNGINKRSQRDVVVLPVEATLSTPRRTYLFNHLCLQNVQILRLQTPLAVPFSQEEMCKLMQSLQNSRVWGLNMGEFCATTSAWRVFADKLQDTTVGFVWINELGKDIGTTSDVHKWLLGIDEYRDNGVLRGRNSPLWSNRMKRPDWYKGGLIRPWYDSSNPALDSPYAKKFLFNPHNSSHFV